MYLCRTKKSSKRFKIRKLQDKINGIFLKTAKKVLIALEVHADAVKLNVRDTICEYKEQEPLGSPTNMSGSWSFLNENGKLSLSDSGNGTFHVLLLEKKGLVCSQVMAFAFGQYCTDRVEFAEGILSHVLQ